MRLHMEKREAILALVTLALIGLVGLRAPVFVSASSLSNLLTDGSVLIMLALAQMLVIVTRGIDLSMASNLALSGMMAALLAAAQPDLPLFVIVLAATVIGLVQGLLNGWLIGYLELPPIVVTLGTMSVFRGLVFVLSGGAWVSSRQLPAHFVDFPLATLFGLSHLVWIAVLVVAAMAFVVRFTRFGRDLYAIGNAPHSAHYIGIDARARLLGVYALSGAMAGLAGYLWVARYAVAYTEIAYGYEFTVIAACVIGGVSIAGGAGSVTSAVLGALFLSVVNNALPVLKISPFWQSALTGAVILAAVLINARSQRAASRQILPLYKTHAARSAA